MTRTGKLPASASFDDVQLKIRESYSNPNIGRVLQVVLKDGPKVFKIATVFEIVDPGTGEFHHYYLRLDHIEKQKQGWFAKPEKSIKLESSEVDDLHAFLASLSEGKLAGRTGDLHIVGSEDYERLANIVGSLGHLPAHDRLELAGAILARLDGPTPGLDQFVRAFADADENVLSIIATASRLVEYEAAYEKLLALIGDPSVSEQQLQRHLQEHPWIFGSEYSELLDRRAWTRDDRLDFMLRRTTDGYLEIVEIKTPHAAPLFRHDASHDSYYPAGDLGKVLGQTIRYIEEIERKRDSIIVTDGVDPLRIRARIIIGRDASSDEQRALRNLNSHLVRIEVITFDQLCKIAKQVLSVFRSKAGSQPVEPVEDLPF